MPSVPTIAKYTVTYILVFAAFYCVAYLLIHVLPVDLNPSIRLTCPTSSPVARRT
ncbi:hypothetical protein [Nocardia sp. NBC_01327]|uniref:hypothetical protein n=1 Tax=Nocardia sp. NBC_01327 TaxID=2903593 RepID=UPI002E105C31|nr:hypothetical protein OG326_34470 [Nocardia sp. NBC_01327]